MLFRNRRLVRVTACFLLIESISSIALPSIGWAFMGPTQPEFSTYEGPGSTDMVNLSTGDFSYNVPVLDIPGPERSFSLPLNYKAGIQLEQEATWVGLGWSLNPGAIVRSVNGYADDADRDPNVSTYRKEIDRGWTGGVPGVIDLGWNSNTGNSGSVNLLGLAGYGWDKSGGDANVIGVTMGDHGISADPVRMIGAVNSIASLGTTAGLSVAADIGIQMGTDIATGIAMGAFGIGRMGEVNGFLNQPTTTIEHHWLYDNYWRRFNNNSTEFAYGSLHFDDMSKSVPSGASNYDPADSGPNGVYAGMAVDPRKAYSSWANSQYIPYIRGPVINALAGSSPQSFKAKPFAAMRVCDSDGNATWETSADVNQSIRKGEDVSYYDTSTRPISIAHDNFNVMGESVSGSIRPYRLDVGSIAYPKMGRNECDKHYKYMVTPFLDDYKVAFRYENSLSNGYDYHEYVPASGSNNEPEGINFTAGDRNANVAGSLTITDPRLMNDGAGNAARTGQTRKGLLNTAGTRRLVQGKHVEWYTNQEIKAMYATSVAGDGSGFLEFAQPTASVGTSPSNNPFRENLPSKGIGAFAVTAEDGTTYHYSLPVYNHKTFSYSSEQQYNTATKSISPITGSRGLATQESGHEVATTWLLTAITSSDYIDRNNSGTVDREDWGGWVKFDYGKLTAQYKWAQPYIGGAYPEDVPVINGSPNSDYITSYDVSQGYRDSYYLNSISTRSHTALFVKSVRHDGKGHFSHSDRLKTLEEATASSLLKIDERAPSASLRLDEIILLDNQTLDKLQTPDGIRTTTATGSVIPALTNDTGGNAATYLQPDPNMNGLNRWFCGGTTCLERTTPDASFSPYDDMGKVLDKHDLDTDVRIRQFIDENALKRVVFHYSYDLCRSTPSSFTQFTSDFSSPMPTMTGITGSLSDRKGKLTLRSISFLGPSVGALPTKIIPDFVFEYGNGTYPAASNPEYGKEKWDGFGMYNYTGEYSLMSHKVSARPDEDGAAWSLTRITNPLGGNTTIKYERDEYSHVAEFGTARLILTNNNSSKELEVSAVPNSAANIYGGFSVADLDKFLKKGDKIPLTGKANFTPCTFATPGVIVEIPPGPGHNAEGKVFRDRFYYDQLEEVEDLRYDSGQRKWFITLVNSPSPQTPNPNLYPASILSCPLPSGTGMSVETVLPCNIKGGDIRVASIVTSDENGTPYQIRYKYQTSAPANGNSSGVLAKEPAFINRFEHAFYSVFDFPATPVLYSEVTVLRGAFKNGANNGDNDYEQREVYAFHTPRSTMITQNTPTWRGTGDYYNPDNSTDTRNSIEYWGNSAVIDVGKIGQPKWVRKYNRRGDEELNTTFDYASSVPNADNIAGQGQFTEGVINNEMLDQKYYRINRSTKRYLPSVMYASQSTRNGVSISNTNTLYDFYTGQVIESRLVNSQGDAYRTRSVPAYSKQAYLAMGAKGDNPNNRNMLSQLTASYVYKEKDNKTEVISAGIQTWKNTWNTYRSFSGGRYQDETTIAKPVWRESANYAWQSAQLNPDGTYANFVDFNWAGNLNSHWLKATEAVRYDHYSHALETTDVNGAFSAQKTGYQQTQVVAAAGNARYTELAYSGAEDPLTINGNLHFGGEILAGGVRDLTKAHTGTASLRLENGQQGFTYQAMGGSDLELGKSYRTSVWIHANDAVARAGKLYIAINGNLVQQTAISDATTKKAGDWYRLTLISKIPSTANGQLVTFGCTNAATAPVYFDDFRVCPVTSSMASRVYDVKTSRLTSALDNENLFTRYEYDVSGKLKRVYKETLERPGNTATPQKLLKEYEYNYARMTTPVWLTWSYECETLPSGGNSGYELRTERDINPLSTTYGNPNPVKPVNSKSGYCHVCGSDPTVIERLVQGVCYPGVKVGESIGPCNTAGYASVSFIYQFGPDYPHQNVGYRVPYPQPAVRCTGTGTTPPVGTTPTAPRLQIKRK